MLEEERKAVIHALSDDDLRYEVERGRVSRFQGALYDYAKTDLLRRNEEKRTKEASASLILAKENRDWMKWPVIVALVAIAVPILSKCSG